MKVDGQAASSTLLEAMSTSPMKRAPYGASCNNGTASPPSLAKKNSRVNLWHYARRGIRKTTEPGPERLMDLERQNSCESLLEHVDEPVEDSPASESKNNWINALHSVAVVAILMNIALVWYEIDVGINKVTGNIGRVICIAFIMDLVTQIREEGMTWDCWELLDICIVSFNTIDSFIIPCFMIDHYPTLEDDSAVSNVGRFLQVLRVIRVVRIFKAFRELRDILKAYAQALSKVVWILCFILVINFCFSCLLALTLGSRAEDWGPDHKDDIRRWFGSVGLSMQTMLVILTLAEWDEIASVLTEVVPGTVVYPLCILYIMAVSFMATSLITGVISESLVNVKEQDPWYKLEELETSKRECQTHLVAYLSSLGTCEDGSKDIYLQRSDLKKAKASTFEMLQAHGIQTSIQEFLKVAEILIDDAEDNKVHVESLVDALTQLRGPAMSSRLWEMRHAMKMSQRRNRWELHTLGDSVDKRMNQLEGKVVDALEGIKEIKELLAKPR